MTGPAARAGDANAGWRTGNAGRLMFAATDALVRDKRAIMQAGGATAGSEAMMSLWLNLDREGTRLTDLAERAGRTKQSMIELVDRAEAMRLVARRADPDDPRAKLVAFTPAGFDMLARLDHAVAAAEERFTHIVGTAFAGRLRHDLSAYAGLPDAPRRRRTIGRLLSLAARRFARDLLAEVHRHGHREVGDVLLALFRHLDRDGTRLTVLAARARVTKQSMRALVDAAQALGLVKRQADPCDRRAKLVGFTPAGLDLLEEVRRGVAVAEAIFADVAGADFVRSLKAGLSDYITRSPHAISSAELPSTGWTEASTTANSSG